MESVPMIFEPVAEPEGMNRIGGESKVSEMPFELLHYFLQNGLWWKIGKTIHTHSADGLIPKYLSSSRKQSCF